MPKNKPKVQKGDFYEVINKAIGENRHVEQLKEIIEEFKNYKKMFEENFTTKNIENAIYKFRATYLLKENVWREIEIIGKQTLEKLSDKIIRSMGWKIDHLHGFSFPHPNPEFPGQVSPYTIFPKYSEDDQYPTFKSDKIHVYDIDYKKQPKIDYIFDFGDGNRFDLDFISYRELSSGEKIQQFPRLTDQRGVAPKQYQKY